jgi:tRNA G18 (ribose-2'-O)-methylase SpoU
MPFRQLEHEEIEQQEHKFPLRLICDGLSNAVNTGMLFRLADGFGVEKIYLCAGTPAPPNRKLRKASRSTVQRVEYEVRESTAAVLDELIKEGYTPLALEVTTNSQDIRRFPFKNCEKIALVIGAEKAGVSEAALEKVKNCLAIPLFGQVSSLNVATAAAIALYEISKQQL